jgi:glycosyltransferase involved in cell wall biosynthesis
MSTALKKDQFDVSQAPSQAWSTDDGPSAKPKRSDVGRRFQFFVAIHRALTFARRQADHGASPQYSLVTRFTANVTGGLWRRMRKVIPRELRTKVESFLLRQTRPNPIRRVAWRIRPKVDWANEVGLRIIGPLSAECGLGEAARGSARAAIRSGIHTALTDFRDPFVVRMTEDLPANPGSEVKPGVNLFHINAPEMIAHPDFFSAYLTRNDYNVGYWLWETTDFPNSWLGAFDFVHELWTSSNFCLDVISRKAPTPVIRIPVCVEPVAPAPLSREDLHLPPNGFLFLAMADFLSTPERKNPMGALDAFHRAFGSTSDEVYLVLKISNSNHRPEIRELLQQRVSADPRIILIEGYMARPDLNALIGHCDCLVSLHRSEGFGLPIAEAMYMGKPAIATGWSANMDFMTFYNSLPVRYRLVPVNEESGPYAVSKGFWADPDLDHAAHQMCQLAENHLLAKELGQAAQTTIHEHFSSEAVGKLIHSRLMFIREHLTQ